MILLPPTLLEHIVFRPTKRRPSTSNTTGVEIGFGTCISLRWHPAVLRYGFEALHMCGLRHQHPRIGVNIAGRGGVEERTSPFYTQGAEPIRPKYHVSTPMKRIALPKTDGTHEI